MGNALAALEAAKSAAEDWLDANPELEYVSKEDLDEDDVLDEHQTHDEEEAGTREGDRSEVEEFQSTLEDAISDLENASFPGMY